MSIAEKVLVLKTDFDDVCNAGYSEGYRTGMQNGYNEGKTDGKRAGREEFWNAFTDNQKRNDYSYGFYAWYGDAFYPTCNIGGTTMQRAFYNFKTCDLIARCEECGIKLDFSKCTSIGFCFASSKVTTVPIIEITKVSKLEAIFNNAYDLTVIKKIVLSESGTQTFSNCFNGCNALVEVRFEGVIGTDITFQHCSLLSVASMKSIILHLANYSGTDKEFIYTVKFTDECWSALEADSTAPTGTSWAEYVDSLGWLI